MLKVLVVDDSSIFRTQISAALKGVSGLEVVGTAANGRIALEKLRAQKIDVMVLDLEMPEMNGLDTLKRLQSENISVKVVIFASQTADGANKAIEAFKLGAVDVVAKPSHGVSSLSEALDQIKRQLVPKMLQFSEPNVCSKPNPGRSAEPLERMDVGAFSPAVVLIASSTGGPTTLDRLVTGLRTPLSFPVLVVQHMPPLFTKSLASRLNKLVDCRVKEGEDGEKISANTIYIAPGGFHMRVGFVKNMGICLHVDEGPMRQAVRPCADNLFESAVEVYGAHCAAFVLTGMGRDGADGCLAVKRAGGAVVIQDQESSVVWGMPGAVAELAIVDRVCGIEECGNLISAMSQNSTNKQRGADEDSFSKVPA